MLGFNWGLLVLTNNGINAFNLSPEKIVSLHIAVIALQK